MNVESIYQEHKDLVYNLALSYTQNPEDAEEITQDVFVIVYEHSNKFKHESKLSTWLYRITINKCLDFIKAKKAQKRFAFITSLFDPISSAIIHDPMHFDHPGVLAERKEELQRIFACINKLSHNQKTALILSKIDKIPHDEIGQIMQLSRKAVESLIQRAKSNLIKNLKNNEGEVE